MVLRGSYIGDRTSLGLIDAALQRQVEGSTGDHQSPPKLLLEWTDWVAFPPRVLAPRTPQHLAHNQTASEGHTIGLSVGSGLKLNVVCKHWSGPEACRHRGPPGTEIIIPDLTVLN